MPACRRGTKLLSDFRCCVSDHGGRRWYGLPLGSPVTPLLDKKFAAGLKSNCREVANLLLTLCLFLEAVAAVITGPGKKNKAAPVSSVARSSLQKRRTCWAGLTMGSGYSFDNRTGDLSF
ncbi:unnamed protein product [Cuscuta campestris]|uniref:Uncharacterized protein n=1 Tax=Cuscuta campestris TaxID=132261 RepID=A0A484NPF4_9ASTE|nr:unnamed protein product [Cuscuta campestris]